MRKGKKRSLIAFLSFIFIGVLVLNNIQGVNAKGLNKPATPSITHDNWDNENDYKVSMSMWWGENGDLCKLYENGKLISEVELTNNSPNEQKAIFNIEKRDKGSYTYKCELVNGAGASSSSEITVTVNKKLSGGGGDLVAPNTPNNLSAKAKDANSIEVTWDSVEGVKEYDLEIDGQVFSSVTSPFIHSGLKEGSKHSYKVRAKNDGGMSAWSNGVTETTNTSGIIDPVIFPKTPANFKVEVVDGQTAKLTWDAVKDAEYYEFEIDHQIYRSTKTEFVKKGLIKGDTYPFRVRSRNSVGASKWTDHLYVKMEDKVVPPNPDPEPNPDDNLPDKLLVGYWHNFDNGSTATPLKDTSLNFDIIDVAFAESMPDQATMYFTPYNNTVEGFRKEVEYLQSKGKKIIISIGGQNGRLHLDTKEKEDIFVNTMIDIIKTYNFDGID